MLANETLNTIKQRRSIRNFKEEQIKEEELQALLQAGFYAPHAGNQAWHFTVVQNKELLEKLNLAAKEGAEQLDIEGLKRLANDEQFNCFYGAPTLILISGDTRALVPLEADCAAATQNILLAAESLGLGGCWIYFVMFAFSSPHGPELLKELQIPEGYRPYSSAVVGYKKEAPATARDRKPDLVTYIR